MRFNQLNEAFDRVYGIPSEKQSVNESKKLNEDVSPAVRDLTDALFAKYRELQNRYETNIKVYEVEFQRVIEGQFPENAWWEVTDCNIFWSLFGDRDPQKTIMDIIAGIKPEFKDTPDSQPEYVDNRRRSIISGDPLDDPGFDEYDIIGESNRIRKNSRYLKESRNIDSMLKSYAGRYANSGEVVPTYGTKAREISLQLDDNAINSVADALVQDGFKECDSYDSHIDGEDSYTVFTKVDGSDRIMAALLYNYSDGRCTLQMEMNGSDPDFNEYFESYTNEAVCRSIKKFLSKLDEKEMSDEDRRDTELIKSVYNKIQKRSNARLTPEEKAVLDKYGITRHNYSLAVGSGADAYLDRNNLITKRGSTYVGNGKVNFADRARKLAGRTERDITARDEYGAVRAIVPNTNSKKYTKNPNSKPGYYMGDVRADQGDRQAAEAGYVEHPVEMRHRDMATALHNRKYHSAELDKVDSRYADRVAKAKAAYEQALRDAEHDRDFSKPYHSDAVNRSQNDIDKILKRK